MKKTEMDRRLEECVKYAKNQWGKGWTRLGTTLQMAVVKAEILSEINRVSSVDCDPSAYNKLVSELAEKACQWWPEVEDGA